ncbi:ABC transporter substrate-binding protein [Maritimibacter sp. HL-12]|uniref:ABC transporter substrate-binding protein n=1 Tax=Maritimibacter sp. HL-12 TaxID=1162418 RepID=UPI000A0F20B3|nr:ABC transporter substrate-binding protein [Maritimibacter sp. HL-12]SMH57522.1 NitT/TauT family transport system substrate-binding protein [Maritimibacter sp. HL-12]
MTLPTRHTRRAVLGAGLAAGAALAAPGLLRAAPMLEALTLYGPPAGPSITLAHAVATGAFETIAASSRFVAWRDPDELRAGLTSGTMQVVILPANAAANLYNRGMELAMVNAMTGGLNYVTTRDPGITTPADLAGRSIALPFRNDTPDILLKRILAEAGLAEADVTIVPAATPIEAVQLLLTGRADAAVLPEPATTMAEMRALQAGQQVFRAIDLQAEWGRITGLGPLVPQAGLAVTRDFDAAHPGAVEALQAAIAATLPEVLANPEAAAASATEPLGMPAPILAKSIPTSALIAEPARGIRPAFEAMFAAVAEVDAAAIGGDLPDAGFYRL